jgi:hypothetical protein
MIWSRIAPPDSQSAASPSEFARARLCTPLDDGNGLGSQHEHVSTARRDWRRRLPPLILGVVSALAVGRAQRRRAAAARILQHRCDSELIEAATRSKKNGVTVEEVFGREPDVMVGSIADSWVRQNAAVSGAGQWAHRLLTQRGNEPDEIPSHARMVRRNARRRLESAAMLSPKLVITVMVVMVSG